MKILVTGGAGYIGSHICVELIEAGHDVIVIDDFSNSKPEVLGFIKDITGKEVLLYEFNLLDEYKTEEVFIENKIDAVIHCAAFKAVGESVKKPIEYYTNNLMSTLILTKMMKKYNNTNADPNRIGQFQHTISSAPPCKNFIQGTKNIRNARIRIISHDCKGGSKKSDKPDKNNLHITQKF